MNESFGEWLLEVGEEDGWLKKWENKGINKRVLEIAEEFLSLGRPPEEVIKATKLPAETVMELYNAVKSPR